MKTGKSMSVVVGYLLNGECYHTDCLDKSQSEGVVFEGEEEIECIACAHCGNQLIED